MSLQEMDAETLSLVLRLQLEDLEELKDRKGKGREGEISDAQLAVNTYQNELMAQEQLTSDLAIARRIARADHPDARLIDSVASEQVPAILESSNDRWLIQSGVSETPQNEVLVITAANTDNTQAASTSSCRSDSTSSPSHTSLPASSAAASSDDSGKHAPPDDKLDTSDAASSTPRPYSQDRSITSVTAREDHHLEVSGDAEGNPSLGSTMAEPTSGELQVPPAAAVDDGGKEEIHVEGSAKVDDSVFRNHESQACGCSPNETGSSSQTSSLLSLAGPAQLEEDKSTIKCDSCYEEVNPEELTHSNCPHRYCRKCLESLFNESLTDEGMFPPRCCQQDIPLDRDFLSERLITEFRAKEAEFEYPDRTYCHRSSCSAFIPQQSFQIDDIATCPKCAEKTCTLCKGATHDGDCPQDMELLQMLRVAEENRWKRCSSCRRVVERTFGCNHMSMLSFFIFGETWERAHIGVLMRQILTFVTSMLM